MTRLPRASGVLLHPTSLPGPHGIGDLGPAAHAFVERLAAARQRLWQVLPLTPTGYGDSPYASPSALAGNPLLISLEPLLDQGLLRPVDVAPLAALPHDHVAFERLVPAKQAALRRAWQAFRDGQDSSQQTRFAAFQREQAWWLDDFTLFTALHDERQVSWQEWEAPLRDREPAALHDARTRLADAIACHAFCQFVFARQWEALHAAAGGLGIRLVGDIPIFVALDSVDVWANPHLFKLDPRGRPRVVAGVPPDYFSQTGQLWGNPLYDWEAMAHDGYRWWVRRFQRLLAQVDVVRIDHFRGFQAAWEVPAGADTAVEGEWVAGPGASFFRAVDAALGRPLPVVAEDLGLITDEVRALLADLGYPGMKVLQFAFGGDTDHPYLPHAYDSPNCVVYTGTHDNDTTRGWYASAGESERDLVRQYLQSNADDVAWELIRLALASTADTAIVPLQDLLDLGSEGRMNVPGAAHGNWSWRASAEQVAADQAWVGRLGQLTGVYGRANRAER